MTLKFTYFADDGYVTGSRPITCSLDSGDLLDECESVEEAMEYVKDAIQEDFDQKVSASYNENQIRETLEQVFATREHD